MTSKERVLATLARSLVDRIPHVELMLDQDVAYETLLEMGVAIPPEVERLRKVKAGAFTEGMSIPDGLTPYQVMLRAHNRLDAWYAKLLGKDNTIFFWSILSFKNSQLYLLDPTQVELEMSADGIVKTVEDVEKIEFNNIDFLVSEAADYLSIREEYPELADLAFGVEIYLGIDPVWHSIGFEDFCYDLMDEGRVVDRFMDRITDYFAELIEKMCRLDFDYVWAADDIAYKQAPFFSQASYREHLLPYTRKVAQKITKPWFYHSDGNLRPILDDLLSQGMNAIHPLEPGSMDFKALRDDYGHRVAFVGGLSLNNLEAGTPEETAEETKDILDIFKGKASYLMSSCNTITPYVKPKNYKAMLETLKKYGKMN